MKKKLIDVFLYGSSLKKLENLGSGFREIPYYNKLSSFFDVLIIDYEKYNSDRRLDFNILSKNKLFTNFKWSIDYNNCVSKNLKINKSTIIVSKQFLGSWLGIILKYKLKTKFFLRMGYSYSKSKKYDSFFGKLLSPIYYLIECLAIILSDGVIFSSETLKKRFFLMSKIKRNIIIPNPYISSFIVPKKKIIERSYDVIYVGRFNKVKNLNQLNLFFNSIDFKSIIISNVDPSIFKNSKVINHLSNDKVYTYLNDSKYYITFSKSEGSPKSTIEAIASGCIPILSNINIHREIINNLGYGYLVNNHKQAIDIMKKKKNNFKDDLFKKFIYQFSDETCLNKFVKFLNQ